MNKKIIYLDNSATTKVRTEVLNEALPYFSDKFGNPSSFHSSGLVTKKAINNARTNISTIIGCNPNEIIFTGSGTESINLAIKGIAFKEIIRSIKENRKINGHFIISKIEHDAVLHTMKWLEKFGFNISYIDVDENGIIKLDMLEKEIKKNTLLVSIMYANNEIGTIEPIKEIAKICHKKNVLLHTDACQGAEYLDINVKNLDVDLMTLNGSKVYSFKGTGLLYKKNGIVLEPLIHGGGHEFGLRAGTENVAGIVGLAKALKLAEKEKIKESIRLTKLRNYFIKELKTNIPKIKINGDEKQRLPNNINVSFYGIEGESILLLLNEAGICASTGSACSSQSLEPSHVLLAIGLKHELAHSSIRFSLGKNTTKKDIDYTIKKLKIIIKKLRTISSEWRD